MRGSRVWKAVISLLFASTLVAALLWWQVFSVQRDTEHLLSVLPSVQVGSTTVEQFRQMAEAAGVTPQGWCQGDTCAYGLQARNRVLRRLRLAPSTGISITVEFKERVASVVSVWGDIGQFSEIGTAMVDEMNYGGRLKCGSPACFGRQDNYPGVPWRVWVKLDATAPVESRKRAFAFNAGCLSRIGGCKNAGELLPSALGPHPGMVSPAPAAAPSPAPQH